MGKIAGVGRHIAFAFLVLFLVAGIKCNVSAEGADEKVVKVGYYENENFQEGASEGAVKSGYAYEYFQKIATYTG